MSIPFHDGALVVWSRCRFYYIVRPPRVSRRVQRCPGLCEVPAHTVSIISFQGKIKYVACERKWRLIVRTIITEVGAAL